MEGLPIKVDHILPYVGGYEFLRQIGRFLQGENIQQAFFNGEILVPCQLDTAAQLHLGLDFRAIKSSRMVLFQSLPLMFD